MEEMIKTTPAVFAAGDEYQIFVPVNISCLMWVKVGGETYYDDSNGILRSATDIHKVTVPMEALDEAGKYTLCLRAVTERKPYFSETGEAVEKEFPFYPVKGERITAYEIADAHNTVGLVLDAYYKFRDEIGKADFLILNGDVPAHCDKGSDFDVVFKLIEGVTGGSIPVVFARGNHDTRGTTAEIFENYTPTYNGKTYFTTKLGNLWMIILDCGEDKADSNEEYGNTNCFSAFRKRETKFVEKVAAERTFDGEGIAFKAVICHAPFTRKNNPPFDIEEDTYKYWAKLLREEIKPDVMICGHTHKLSVDETGGEKDAFGQPCTVVVGSEINFKEGKYAGAGFIFENGKIKVVFNDKEKILNTYDIK